MQIAQNSRDGDQLRRSGVTWVGQNRIGADRDPRAKKKKKNGLRNGYFCDWLDDRLVAVPWAIMHVSQ